MIKRSWVCSNQSVEAYCRYSVKTKILLRFSNEVGIIQSHKTKDNQPQTWNAKTVIILVEYTSHIIVRQLVKDRKFDKQKI